jgi:two-component system, cell cycle response regulator
VDIQKKSSLIIVDDDPVFLTMLENGLSLGGYRCEMATSALNALERIQHTQFDILLTDIAMPGMQGFDLAIQAKHLRPDIAIIIMTGYIDDFSYDKAIEAGASDFIKKPFTLKELIARIEHVKMNEYMRTVSFTDELTGLYNRRGFFTLVDHLLKVAKRQENKFFMLYGDLDNLKVINDTFGHLVGDKALTDAAKILKDNFRESDIIARIGGDEFVVMPIGSDGAEVHVLLDRLQRKIEDYNRNNILPYELSLSIGITFFDPQHPCSIDSLLSQADKSMYENKWKKKNGKQD